MKARKLSTVMASASALSLIVGTTTLAPALAQEASTVTGEVRRGEGRELFAGVTVEIPELGLTETTDANGRFSLEGVPPGTYRMVISYLGEQLETRTVTVGEAPMQLAINLDERMLETVIVTGRRGAIQSATALERAADTLKSIVTSDDIGQFGDPTVAESLQRIPGLSINRSGGEGQQVSIRGLPTEFATVTLDGARLGTSDPEINSTNLDFFSADNLSQIEVTKTLLPEDDADAIAGAIDLKTISAFRRGENTVSGRVEYGYREKAESWNPKVSGDFTRIFELDNVSRFGVAAGITWSEREIITDEAQVGDGLNFFTLEEYDDDGETVQEYFQDGDVEDCQDTQEDGTILECYLIPVELDFRSEEETRTRLSLNGQVEYEVGNHLFQLRGSYAETETEGYTNRVTFDFSRSDGDVAQGLGTDDPDVDEVVAIGVNQGGNLFGVFEDGRSERRLRPSDEEEEVYTIGFEGTSEFGERWTFNYGADYSSNTESRARIEGRFRSDNITMDFSDLSTGGVDIVLGPEVFDVDDDDPDPTTPGGFPLRSQTINGERFGTPNETFSDSEDTYETWYANLERRLDLFGRDAELKVGFKQRNREREFDFTRVEYLVDPDFSLADFPTKARADRSDLFIPHDVERGAVTGVLRDLIASGRVATVADRGIFITIADLQDDFTAEEDITAGYLQLSFEPIERVLFIVGVRGEQTDYTTTGSAVRQLDYDDGITDALQTALENGGVAGDAIDAFLEAREPRSVIEDRTGGNDYTEWFPSLNIRWEPTDEFVIRASYTEGLKRPEFREAAAIQFLTTTEQLDDDLFCETVVNEFGGTTTDGCDGFDGVLTSIDEANAALAAARTADGGLAFETEADPARNPFLDPLTSQNFDASIAWYPNANTVLSAAVFHKEIDSFIVPISLRGDDVTRLGFEVDDGTETSQGISIIDTFANGDTAEITGLELSYYQAYTFLPAPFDGLFVQGNATFADSSASSDLVDRDFQFPDQSDLIGNLSIGWENDVFSVRAAMAYQGERLRAINEGRLEDGSDTAGDLIEDERTQFDVNVRWEVRDGIQLYLDAININDAEDNLFFRGSNDTLNGRFFARLENYGPTYQFGLRVRY